MIKSIALSLGLTIALTGTAVVAWTDQNMSALDDKTAFSLALLDASMFIERVGGFDPLPSDFIWQYTFVDTDEMLALVGNDQRMATQVIALYDEDTNTMYLRTGFNPYLPDARATLVHELTHVYQDAAGTIAAAACPSQVEYAAYDMQAQYEQINTPGFDKATSETLYRHAALSSVCLFLR